ncbi:dnaJ homolog subfamily A member 1-like [Canis lupus baileyi]|uniref:dnaJ homolog subfamily A member 1-like n=1 Tax=Canis lupus dingo TaxID=286419 RepID=UPI0002749AD2|nr:dnaJ homolog subfamily A member 1-like isoform X1 [Canis lupus familiaris]XP_038381730.1 dnaJ homolog subfamily A member 1-like isoform X1 [Canis lupus familiaris]XP_038509861.1 dnaJ homolog subfamily A member 1-like isoform X1 [Canis lupus familiaris]XP_048967898.1 dnaJ homolog subfamily A member 1-like [Canis lupus dingo]
MIILDQKDRALFTQPGEDLFMYTHIQLVEALCSFQNPVSTLDNQTTVITSQQGQIVKHGDIKCVLNEGMLIDCRPYEKGCLIMEFKVLKTFGECHGLNLCVPVQAICDGHPQFDDE